MIIAEKVPREALLADAQARYRAQHPRSDAPAPDPVNHEAAVSLFEAVPLVWGGATYHVRPIGYREGLKLQRLGLRFERMQAEKATDEAAIDAHEALVDETLDLCWSFLEPRPAVNPFLDATPLEVGGLSGFFFACLRIQNLPARMAGTRLSLSTT